jgi:hypothetical protein
MLSRLPRGFNFKDELSRSAHLPWRRDSDECDEKLKRDEVPTDELIG